MAPQKKPSKSAVKSPKAAKKNGNVTKLYLMEFLVDDLNIQRACECTGPTGEVCVTFQFLDNEALAVCEGDFDCNSKWEDNNSRIGKSVLFSLTPKQLQDALKRFDIFIQVVKNLEPGCDPNKITLGSAMLSAAGVLKDLATALDKGSTGAKVLETELGLKTDDKKPTGKIAVYLRLSCYGNMIVTQFQMNMQDKSVLFKDKEGQSLYRYKKTKKQKPCGSPPPQSECSLPPCCC